LYQQPGQYTVTLTAIDTLSGNDSTISLTNYIHVYPNAIASFYFTQIDQHISLINVSQNASGYRWEFGDGDISFLDYDTVIHSYPYNGSFTVTLTAYDHCGGSHTDTQFVSITVGVESSPVEDEFNVYRTGEMIFLNFESGSEKGYYSIEAVTGQKIVFNRFNRMFPGETASFSVSHLPAGIYYLVIHRSNSTLTRRIFIE
jgi:PKD repeat protein